MVTACSTSPPYVLSTLFLTLDLTLSHSLLQSQIAPIASPTSWLKSYCFTFVKKPGLNIFNPFSQHTSKLLRPRNKTLKKLQHADKAIPSLTTEIRRDAVLVRLYGRSSTKNTNH